MINARRRSRYDWVDAAKAVSIILVVMYHARHLSYILEWKVESTYNLYWDWISIFFKPLRMPLFFLISGLLMSSSLWKDWSEISTKRFYKMYYVYAIWAIFFAVLIPAFPHAEWSAEMVIRRILGAASGDSLGWYIWALSSFFLFGWATKSLPAIVPIMIAASLAVFAIFTEGVISVRHTSMLRCLLFFIIGLRLPQFPIQLANMASKRLLVWTFAAFCTIFAFSLMVGSTFNPFVDSLAVAAGIMAAKLAVSRWPRFAGFGVAFAKLTLPVYLLHFLVLVVILKISAATMPESFLSSYGLALLFPLIAATLSILVSLGLYRFALRIGAYWLFDLPRHRFGVGAQPAG